MDFRLQQSWAAFHRLHQFLIHKRISLRQRFLLWQSCIWPIMHYGLTSVGIDAHSADRLRAQATRQLRMVARSPAHVTHETNADVLNRLGFRDPVVLLSEQCAYRLEKCRTATAHIQPARVHQWWTVLQSSFQGSSVSQATTKCGLTEVTQVARLTCCCKVCGQSFPSTHALSVHIGKQHPETRPSKKLSTKEKNVRVDAYRIHSFRGLPQCRHCMKKFYGWPQLMGHISQQACPVLHFGEATALAAPAAETHADPVPTIVAREDNNPDTTFSVSTVPAPESGPTEDCQRPSASHCCL